MWRGQGQWRGPAWHSYTIHSGRLPTLAGMFSLLSSVLQMEPEPPFPPGCLGCLSKEKRGLEGLAVTLPTKRATESRHSIVNSLRPWTHPAGSEDGAQQT